MNDYEGFGDARSRNTLSPIREETERVRKTVRCFTRPFKQTVRNEIR